jgi:hypothetical protein
VSVAVSLTICTLMGASLRAVLTRSTGVRCWCSGFSLFGWGHLLLVGSKWRKELPTDWLISQFMDLAMAKYEPFPTRGPSYTEAMHAANHEFWVAGMDLVTLYLTLMVAFVGGLLTGWLARRDRARMTDSGEV